jgi:Holliday junction resolvasome RuvABC endonuclease subunit
MRSSPARLRIIAVDPSPRGFGFAVIEGPRRLVDWGLVHVPKQKEKNMESIRRLADLVGLYSPHVLVVEDCGGPGCRRRPRVRTLIADMVTYGDVAGVEVRQITWRAVREATVGSRANKEAVAQAVARMFPELADRLPPHRKIWMSEDPRMSLFDAVGLGLGALLQDTSAVHFATDRT